MQTIAATTIRTGLRVRAELDASAYDTGVKVSDRQMDALPLARHDWHGDWNCTLRPEAYDQDAGAPDPFDRPSPDLAWLCHPALTGLPAQEWDTLIAALMSLHHQQRETNLDKRRGRRPVLTLADRLLATTLYQRLALPQVAMRQSTSASAISASSWTRPGTPSSLARTGSPAWTISEVSRPQRKSPCLQRSRQRVNHLQALKAAHWAVPGARRGGTSAVMVTGGYTKRVSLVALIAVRPGQHPRLIYRMHSGRHGNPRKGFAEDHNVRSAHT